ncbi:STAS domain-containing protein [Fuerstiella marisgermanici]|uniref:Anti-sigma factor antagonist n=1 Tax=Fuerstiella marisgermanici TaxID=1891926 RepID=A0A1P8WCD3_9PLAN|nr:STAS domain-containing protein [Fuerstiella marisgermanici]APZ91721.1 Anti-anti-sigma-B factor [Fuerstiella marisgermanici]
MIHFHTYHLDGSDDVLIVELAGRLDTDSAETFFKRLDEEIENGHVKLVFDCHKLEHVSSLGFGMMIRGHSRVQKVDGAVRFARLEGIIAEAFQVVGFHKLFDNYESVEAAVASVA